VSSICIGSPNPTMDRCSGLKIRFWRVRRDSKCIVSAFCMRFLSASLLILCSAGITAQQPQTKPASPSHRVKHQEPVNNNQDNAGSHAPPSEGAARNSTTTFVLQESTQQNDEGRKQTSYWEKITAPDILPIWIASFVAIVGTVVAVCTLIAIKDEAKEIRDVAKAASDNARAAQTSADAYMVSQRAQLIGIPMSTVQGFAAGQMPIVAIEIKNTGLTPAYHCSYETWIEVLSVPFVDFSPSADYFKAPFPLTIYPNSPAPVVVNVSLRHALSFAEYLAFPPGHVSLCFRVRIEYEDAFKKPRWAEFGYEFTGQRMGALPKYNDAN
jgi:hypothetical protein